MTSEASRHAAQGGCVISTTTKVLIGCGIAALVGLILLAIGGFAFYRLAVAPSLKMPAALNTPRVVQGAGFVTCREFFRDTRLGGVTDILLAELDSSPGRELGIAGEDAAVLMDTSGGAKSWVMFGDTGGPVDFVDVENDGTCEFMGRGGHGNDAILMDHRGNRLWAYGGSDGVDDMACGDMNGDGRLEFVVGFIGGGGIHLLDSSGHVQWKQPDANVGHVEITDTDGNGSKEIVHSNARHHMVIRDKTGAVVNTAKPRAYFSDFTLCHWPTRRDPWHSLSAEGDKIWLLRFDGSVACELPAPLAGTLGEAYGTPAKLRKGEPEYLAVVVAFYLWDRSILYIYDGAGKLTYQETLPEMCSAIAAVPDESSGLETLLVGGDSRVLQYAAPTGE